MENNFECTCWDVNAEGCEFCRVRDLTACEIDWDDWVECEGSGSYDEDGYNDADYDDELPF